MSDKIIQKRALRGTFKDHKYRDALNLEGITSFFDRRDLLTNDRFNEIVNDKDHKLANLLHLDHNVNAWEIIYAPYWKTDRFQKSFIIRHLLRTKQLITVLNRLGRSESYDFDLEIETALTKALNEVSTHLIPHLVKGEGASSRTNFRLSRFKTVASRLWKKNTNINEMPPIQYF